MTKMILFVLFVSVASLSYAKEASEATQEDLDRATTLFKEGNSFYKSKDFSKALTSYQEAYKLVETPGLTLNIAKCHKNLGNAPEALRYYRLYLEIAPDTPKREEIEKGINELEEKLKTIAASQPASAPTPTSSSVSEPMVLSSSFSPYQSRDLLDAFDKLEALTNSSNEQLEKINRRQRFILPGAIALVGGGLGLGALLVGANIELTNTVNPRVKAQHLALAIGSDVAFAASGFMLYRAISKNKKEAALSVSLSPTIGGAVASFALQLNLQGDN